uniref:Transcription factor Iwr1 domain-containing protein n=1 Tax=Amphora coffeiformis TaxID=265554 RepID=A0A7S3P7K4_9STRA|mmetsp:Transcript_11206/g.21352  ORF Transcript_11206/g.21352 Transcript_11206/m.21352 type:complete len:360 (+) Transcript_11206:121-1200(+)|eukprot:scaffold710_cov171-Amphora_coffeaeformis.AAC.7
MAPKTYLRVRRRRNAGTALTLRLDGLEEAWNGNKDATTALAATVPEPRNRKRSAVWRRVSSELEETAAEACRVVEAILSESDEESEQAPSKRRRLTLVQPSTRSQTTDKMNPPTKHGFKILNPVERLVDDSLQAVAVGTITPRQYADFIWTDTRVSHQARKWLAWRNSEIGTLLHAAAMWNDAELTADLLRMDIPQLAEALDGEGRTPFEVAELAGNETVQEVMECFGADTKNFVYDLYCLQDQVESELVEENDDENSDYQMACLLKNGMGYWNEYGELMLEREDEAQQNGMDDPEHDDEDSNDEGWQGNDYPDEDAWVDNNNDSDDEGLRRKSSEDDGEFDHAYGIYEHDGADIIRPF